jgi:rubrerythrin
MAPPDPKARKARRSGIRPTGSLKVVADAKKYDESLILGPTQKWVLAREGQDLSRRQDIIHPSEMSHGDWCPLATYLRIKNLREGGTFTKEAFGFQALNIFQHGHEVHHKWQTWLAEQGILWGTWSCMMCEWQWQGMSGRSCPSCGNKWVTYDEIPLNAETELLISGSADGGVPEHQALMEFKTVGAGTLRMEDPELVKAHTHKTVDGKQLIDYEGLWRSINRPFSSHQKQGQIYLHICALRGLNFDKVAYIYESKFHQGTKEFVVKRRESLIAPLLDQAQQIKDALDNDGPVPKCPHGGCKHCTPKHEGESSGTESTTGHDEPVPSRRRGSGTRRPGAPVRRPAQGEAA